MCMSVLDVFICFYYSYYTHAHIYTAIKVLLLHDRFLDACLKECLLASQDALNILTKLMGTCLLFAEHVHNFTERVHHLGGTGPAGGDTSSMGNKGLRSRSPIRTTTSNTTHRPTTTTTNTTTINNTRQSYSTRTSTGSNQEEEDEILLQKRAKTSINNRLKRQLLYNIQSDYIIKESRQESFAKYLTLFEDKFDKEVGVG